MLLRAAFWIGVVLVLLPTGETKPESETAKIGAVDAISAATSAVADASQFCSRNPETCVTGTNAAVALGQRAIAGAHMVYDFLSDRVAPGETGSVSKTPEKADRKTGAAKTSQHTLKPADLGPAHRIAPARQEVAAARDKRG